MRKIIQFLLVLWLPFVVFSPQTWCQTIPVDATWMPMGNEGFTAMGVDFTSLAIDPAGQAFVAFQDFENADKATVMKYDGNTWVNIGNAGFSPGASQFTSLAFSQTGLPCVAFEDYGYVSEATVMQFDGTDWIYVGNGSFSAGNASYTSLAFSPLGQPYVAYCDWANDRKATVMKYDFPSGERESELPGMSLCPNPVAEVLNIGFNDVKNTLKVIEIYDVKGTKILETSTHLDRIILDVEKYPNGIYFVKIRTGTINYTGKFSKI